MTPRIEQSELMTKAECDKIHECFSNSVRFWIGTAVTILLAVSIPLATMAMAQSETNARQDERIKAIEEEKTITRQDIKEIKQMLMELSKKQ
jgi:hypothetical protein